MLDSLVREWRNYSSQRETFSQEATLQMVELKRLYHTDRRGDKKEE